MPTLRRDVERLERKGMSLTQALHEILIRPGWDHEDPLQAGRLLSLDRDSLAVQGLVQRFFALTEKDDLYTMALRIETLNDRKAVPPLIQALLHDENPHRRHAAARALGWIRSPGRAAALALASCVADPNQPQPAREEAAESLHYVGTPETVDALISVLGDPDVRLRFWGGVSRKRLAGPPFAKI